MKQYIDFRIYDWMLKKLKLTGNELLVFSLIYNLEKYKKIECSNISFFSKKLNLQSRTVFRILKKLKQKNLIFSQTTGFHNQNIYFISKKSDLFI